MKIIFLDSNASLCQQWRHQINCFFKSKKTDLTLLKKPVIMEVKQIYLNHLTLPPSNGRTIVVSPGNSLGFLGGGIDRAIGELFSPSQDLTETELKIKKYLRNGYSAPKSPRLIEFTQQEISDTDAWKNLQANCILHIPTMRTPRSLGLSNLEAYRFVFDLTWNILETIVIEDGDKLENIIIPGLATGYGGISDDIASKAMIAAVSIFCNEGYDDFEKAFLVLRFLQEDPTMYLEDNDKALEKFDTEKNELDQLFTCFY